MSSSAYSDSAYWQVARRRGIHVQHRNLNREAKVQARPLRRISPTVQGREQALLTTCAPMPKINKTASAERLQFVEPMYARAVQQLPDGKDWVYEVKFDGYRCLAGRDSTGVTLWSRRGNRFTDQFPTMQKRVSTCRQIRSSMVRLSL